MKRRPLCALCLLVICFVAAGLWLRPPTFFTYEEVDREQVTLLGRVYEKQWKTGVQSPVLELYIEPEVLLLNDRQIPFQDNFIVTLNSGEKEPPIGTAVWVEGEFAPFSRAGNPGQFDSRAYYASLGISAKLKQGRIVDYGGQTDWIKEGLWQFKCAVSDRIGALFSEEDAGVVRTMLLGDKSTLDTELKALYQMAGISHILSVSGLHITLLGMGLYRILKKIRLPVRVAAPVSGGVMILYGIMIGMPVSACRAIGMFLVRLLADCVKRTYDMLTALTVCGACMVVSNPLLLTNAGFLYSCSAILGLALVPVKTFAVLLFCLPVQLSFYYETPLFSAFLNLAVVPLAGAVLALSGLAVGVGCLFPWLGQGVAFFVHVILKGYEESALFITNLPGNTLIIGAPKPWQILLFYGLLFLAVGLPGLCRKYRIGLLLGGVGFLCLTVVSGLTVVFLDVGQGDGACVFQESGRGFLIDGGSSSESKLGQYRLEPFLKYQGIHTLESVFLSHLDSDHISGVSELMADGDITIEKIVLSAGLPKDEAWEGFLAAAGEADIPVFYMEAGDIYRSGELAFRCLYAGEGTTGSDRNETSLVLLLEYRDFQAVFTGDISAAAEQYMVEAGVLPPDCDVLKVAHHGSATSSSSFFLESLKPKLSVISCGEGNSYGHPSRSTLERLSAVESGIVITMETGAVTVLTDGKNHRVRAFRSVAVP